jgi:hypothetical protein
VDKAYDKASDLSRYDKSNKKCSGYFKIPVVDEGSKSKIEEGIERPNSSSG